MLLCLFVAYVCAASQVDLSSLDYLDLHVGNLRKSCVKSREGAVHRSDVNPTNETEDFCGGVLDRLASLYKRDVLLLPDDWQQLPADLQQSQRFIGLVHDCMYAPQS